MSNEGSQNLPQDWVATKFGLARMGAGCPDSTHGRIYEFILPKVNVRDMGALLKEIHNVYEYPVDNFLFYAPKTILVEGVDDLQTVH